MIGNKATMRYCVSSLRRFRNSDSRPLVYGTYAKNIEGMNFIVRERILPGNKGMTTNLSVPGNISS